MKDSQDQLIEIKVSSANLEEAYKQQIPHYLENAIIDIENQLKGLKGAI